MVLDGHNGCRACEFARKCIPSVLLQRDLGESGERAAESLRYTFARTEEKFFMMLDPSITRKMGLQMEMQVRDHCRRAGVVHIGILHMRCVLETRRTWDHMGPLSTEHGTTKYGTWDH